MDDTSKLRMNLAAIKKVDPYAKDIVDTSPHVAFYTFNSDKNEWEKTDVEGAFFVYSRNAQPYYSVFINNRLNTTSFVEPVTGQLELQSQPPFLLYRNERSRIRGFWFYNSEECDRIGNLLKTLVEQNGGGGASSGSGSDGGDAADNNSSSTANHNNNNNNISTTANGNGNQDNSRVSTPKQANVNIFNMLSKAQQEYNNMQNADSNLGNAPSGSVLKFFAAAKPTIPTNSETVSYAGQSVMPLSVEELEQQQRTQTPVAAAYPQQQQFNSVTTIPKIEPNGGSNMVITNIKQEHQQQQQQLQSPIRENKIAAANATPFEKLFLQANSSFKTLPTGSSSTIQAHASCINVNDVENQLRNLLAQDVVTNSNSHSIGGIVPVIPSTVSLLNSPLASTAPMEFPINPKPALMPPTMFERSSTVNDVVEPTPKPIQAVLNQSQMAQALIYLMQNDPDFVQKLHDAYVKVSTNKSLVDTFY